MQAAALGDSRCCIGTPLKRSSFVCQTLFLTKLLNLTKRFRDLLQITKLYTVFDIHEDEAHAVRSFSAKGATG